MLEALGHERLRVLRDGYHLVRLGEQFPGNIDLRIQCPHDPLDVHSRLSEQCQFVRERNAVPGDEVHELQDHDLCIDLLKGSPQGGAEHVIHIAAQSGQVDALPGDTCGVDDLGDPFRVPKGNGHGKTDQQIPHPRGEPSHEPEIDHADAAVLEKAQVARVGVRMEETVHEDLLVGLLEKDAGDSLAIVRLLDPCDRHAFEILHHDDARGTELCIHFRDDQQACLGSVSPEGLDRADLVREVEFFLHGRGELVDPPLRVVAAHLDDRSLEHPGNAPEKIQVRVDHLFDLGPPDLDHHLPAVFQSGPVYLADRCGGHRLFVDPVEDLLDPSRQVPVQFLLDFGPGEG